MPSMTRALVSAYDRESTLTYAERTCCDNCWGRGEAIDAVRKPTMSKIPVGIWPAIMARRF